MGLECHYRGHDDYNAIFYLKELYVEIYAFFRPISWMYLFCKYDPYERER